MPNLNAGTNQFTQNILQSRFYATPSGHNEFQDELSKYKRGKGSVQFPLNQPIPYQLIERIVKFRVAENNEKAKKG